MRHVLALDVPTDEWRKSIHDWEHFLQAAGLSKNTVYVRISHIRKVAREIDVDRPKDTTPAELLMWCASQKWKTETRHSYYVSIRQYFEFLFGSEDNPANILPPVKRKPGKSRPTPETIIHDALSEADERLTLIIRLGVEVGLRGFEIAKVHINDIQADLLGWTLRVKGKGERFRDLPIPTGFAQRLIDRCQQNGGYAFPGNENGHLSRKWISTLVSRVLPKPWTLHTLRHRFANAAFRESHDITAVQELLGHSSLETTRTYIATSAQAMRDAARGAQLPLSRPQTTWIINAEVEIVLRLTPLQMTVGGICVPLDEMQLAMLAGSVNELLQLTQEKQQISQPALLA